MPISSYLKPARNCLKPFYPEAWTKTTPCLQRILIRTFPYNFTVRYLPGLKNQLADCLSQVGGLQDSIKLPQLSVYQITSQLNARSDSLQQIREANTSWWHTCHTEIHYTTGMAKQYQGGPKIKYNLSGPSMKELNHRRWSGIKRHQNCHTKQETR